MLTRLTLFQLAVAATLAGAVVAVACDQAPVAGPTDSTAPSPSTTASGAAAVTAPATPTSPGVPADPAPGSPPAGSGSGGSGPQATGTFSLLMKDSPFSDASALLVTFSSVLVHRSDEADDEGDDADEEGEDVSGHADAGRDEWVPLAFAGGAPSRTCDLKRLTAATDVLGVGTLPAGHYTQVRLVVSSARLYTTAMTTGPTCGPSLTLAPTSDRGVDVTVNSGTLKLTREFTVPAAGTTTMLLDFDGDASVHKTGNGKYKMTPVIHVVSVQ